MEAQATKFKFQGNGQFFYKPKNLNKNRKVRFLPI